MKLQKLYAKKNLQELNSELYSLLRSQASIRMQIKMGQINQTHLLRQVRRNIARIKTCLVDRRMRSGNV